MKDLASEAVVVYAMAENGIGLGYRKDVSRSGWSQGRWRGTGDRIGVVQCVGLVVAQTSY